MTNLWVRCAKCGENIPIVEVKIEEGVMQSIAIFVEKHECKGVEPNHERTKNKTENYNHQAKNY